MYKYRGTRQILRGQQFARYAAYNVRTEFSKDSGEKMN